MRMTGNLDLQIVEEEDHLSEHSTQRGDIEDFNPYEFFYQVITEEVIYP